jgi:multidrug efflux pump subunit AcrB
MQTANHSERRDAMDNFLYYAFALVVLVVGLFILKKVATCMIKMAVGVIMIAVLFAIYWLYLS